MLRYDSDITTQKEEELVVLRTCYDPQHMDKSQYSHDIYGRKDHVIIDIKQA